MLYEHITLTACDGTPVLMDVYCPDVKGKDDRSDLRTGVVICGGGGYAYISDRETEPVALRFCAMGLNAYVIHYRTAPWRFPSAVQDVAGAVAYVRENAERYLQHPGRIAVLGFSAGGHAACSLGVMWKKEELWQPIGRTPEEVKPDAMILCYPVITAGEHAHRGSFENLTGTKSEDLKEWRELQTRWTQFGCFIPLYRTHGQWPTREVFNIAPDSHPAYKSIVFYHKLRYYMMPYIYSLAAWCNLKDYTMMRGLPMDFADDVKVRDIKDQWMFGPSFMACPVGEYKSRSREVYFPEGGWYDLYSNLYIKGGQTLTVDAPYERMPVFVREGSIVPFGPAMQWSDEKPAELINLYVYEGADGEFMLYEDEGTNYNYEQGKYATITFKYDNTRRRLTIGERKGEFDGMLKKRRFNVVFIKKQGKQTLNLDNPKGKIVNYDGKKISIRV